MKEGSLYYYIIKCNNTVPFLHKRNGKSLQQFIHHAQAAYQAAFSWFDKWSVTDSISKHQGTWLACTLGQPVGVACKSWYMGMRVCMIHIHIRLAGWHGRWWAIRNSQLAAILQFPNVSNSILETFAAWGPPFAIWMAAICNWWILTRIIIIYFVYSKVAWARARAWALRSWNSRLVPNFEFPWIVLEVLVDKIITAIISGCSAFFFELWLSSLPWTVARHGPWPRAMRQVDMVFLSKHTDHVSRRLCCRNQRAKSLNTKMKRSNDQRKGKESANGTRRTTEKALDKLSFSE